MSNFKPNTDLYGMKVVFVGDDGLPTGEGTLKKITSPFTFVVDSHTVEIGQSDDMWISGDTVYIQNAEEV